MSDKTFRTGDRVVHKVTYRKSRVAEDPWGVCSEDEVPVRWNGEIGYVGTDPALLENFFDVN